MGRNITILVPPEHHPDIKQHIAELLTGKTLEHEVDNIAKDGTVHHMELRETAIPLADGRTGILSVTNDITERKRIEAVLHETNQTLEALIAASPLAIVIVDPAGLIRLWNPAAESIFGWKAEEVLGKPNPIVPPEKLEEVLDLQKRITDGCETVLGLEVTRRRKNESPIQVSLSTAALHGNDGTVTGVMAIIEDITERKQAAAALHQRNTFIEMILENSPIGFAVNTVDDGRAQFVSSRFEEIYGVPHDSLDSAESFFNEVYHDQEFRAQIRSRTMSDIASGDPARMIWEDIPITTRAGITKYVTATNIPLYEQNLMVSTVQDVTARRLAEEQTRASLREKEVLLKEIHHRVKNNLQVISSLLNLQSSYVKDSHALELFKESQNRVKSMALIHEKLYQSENFANIDFAFYVKNLTGFLYRSYVIDPSIVTIAVDIQGIQLNIEKAIPCGLIINELVSNSLKYAFPSGNAGRVFVGLTASDDSILKLVVSDNGVGLPEHISLRAAESLGLQLVASLADQLGATIEVKRVGGTEYGISFPR
jgi:PAS domain S-box-containing protein